MGYNLTQINPAYTLVSDVVVGTATTSVDFTGLSIGKEDDYMFVSTVVNGTASGALYRLFVNNNTTNTNYYYQSVDSNGTSNTASRANEQALCYAFANSTSFNISLLKLTNNGYYLTQSNNHRYVGSSSTYISKIVSTSTFTATSITQLTITASVASAIGAGSRFQLYKRVAPIIADITVSTATTSVDITGLSIDKGSEYVLVSSVVSNANGVSYSSYVNGNATDTNYYSQFIAFDGVGIGGSRGNSPFIMYTSASSTYLFSNMNIKLTNNGYCTYQSNGTEKYGGSSIAGRNAYGTSTFTATSITQLTITASVANGIGIGSRFQLIKLK